MCRSSGSSSPSASTSVRTKPAPVRRQDRRPGAAAARCGTRSREDRRATYLQDTGQAAPEMWAAVAAEQRPGAVPAHPVPGPRRRPRRPGPGAGHRLDRGGARRLRARRADRRAALRRLRKAAAAAGKLAEGDTDVRVRDAIGGGRVRDETDDLARRRGRHGGRAAGAAGGRAPGHRRHRARAAHPGDRAADRRRTAAAGPPHRAGAGPGAGAAHARRGRAGGGPARRRLGAGRAPGHRAGRVRHPAGARPWTRRIDGAGRARTPRSRTDPRRLERILGNLLANAARHGKPPIEVTVEGRVLRVRDHGPGFPEALLREGPSRFRTGSERPGGPRATGWA